MFEELRDLIGQKVKIIKSTNSSNIGLQGEVIFESLNMISILLSEGIIKNLEKKVLLIEIIDRKLVIDGARIKNIYTRTTLTSYE